MKLVCMAQMYNENTHVGVDGKTNLQRFMDSISKYCDALVMFDDGSTDDSRDLVMSYLFEDRLQEIEIPGNPPGQNNFKNELYHKARSLEHCRRLNADWVFWLDCDEVIEAKGERGGVRELCEATTKGGVNLFERNLWRTDRVVRVDELWAQGLFCRLWKLTDALSFDIKPGLHHSLAPDGIVGRDTGTLKVIHYGYADDESIIRKYNTYKAHGQTGRALDRMIDESSLRLGEASPDWFSDPHWPYGSMPGPDWVPLRKLVQQ